MSILNIFSLENFRQLKPVLYSKNRFLFFLSTTFFSYLSMTLLSNLSLITSFLTTSSFSTTLKLSYSLFTGFPGTVSSFNLYLTLFLSILIGLNLTATLKSLTENKIRLNQSGSLLGILLAPLASLCSVCVTSIAIAGFSVSLALFPFGGLELSFLAALLLIFSLFWTIEKNDRMCSV